jgi:hypothetical protein
MVASWSHSGITEGLLYITTLSQIILFTNFFRLSLISSIDPICRERNDQSFIFVVETDGQAIVRLLLHPTVIDAFQARRARHNERKAIVATMQRLCMKLNTATTWDEQAERLEVRS